MNRHPHLAWPTYQVAFVLVTIPVVESVLSILPLKLGDMQWRFGSTGLFSRALLTPLLGILLAFAVASLLEHRAVLRALAILSALTGILLSAVLLLFLLDALQMRASVNPRLRTVFDLTTVLAAVKYLAATTALCTLSIGGWKGSRRRSPASSLPPRAAPLLAFGARPTAASDAPSAG